MAIYYSTCSVILKLYIIIISALCHHTVLKTSVAANVLVEPLWDVPVNGTQPCGLEDRIASKEMVVFRGNENTECSIHINASSGYRTVVEIPDRNASSEQYYFYIERVADLTVCTNKYVVIHGNTRACHSVFAHENVRLNLQGNVNLNISWISTSDSSYAKCPEVIDETSPTDAPIDETPDCINVKGYNNQIQCSKNWNDKCKMYFPPDCNGTLGDKDVVLQCTGTEAGNKLPYTQYAMLMYPSDVQVIELRGNNIGEISDDSFHRLKDLEVLDLAYNSLTTLHKDVFISLRVLRLLYLTGNQLVQLKIGLFQRLTMLTSLHLSYNKLRILPIGVLTGLTHVDKLYLNANKLTILHANVFQDSGTLTMLHLADNELTTLSTGLFDGLVRLDRLYLYRNLLSTIGDNVFKGLAITRLSLHSNQLTTLPDGIFQGLDNLNILFLHENQLSRLDNDTFQDLGMLNFLSMRNNNLNVLSKQLFIALNTLNKLYLSGNELVTLNPSTFAGLGSLTHLHLYDNNLTTLPERLFHGLGNLLDLTIHDNHLVALNDSIFRGLNALSFITLSDNKLITLPVGLFRGLINLDEVFLAGNQFVTLEHGLFSNLNNLRTLSVSRNKLVTLPATIFNGLNNLKFLFLDHNKLQNLNSHIFRGLFTLQVLLANDNQLSHLDIDIFADTSNITLLVLSANRLKEIPNIKHLTQLSFLNLRNNTLTKLTYTTFIGLRTGSELFVSQHEICHCYVPGGVNCSAADNRSPFLTCDRLLSDRVLVIMMWLIGINALCGNAFVLVWRKKNTEKYKVQDVLLSNLAMSDLLMGIYMVIVACADIYYGEQFPMQSETWRSGITCRIAGAISIVSSEASVFFVTLISFDRLINIKYPYSMNKMNKTSTIVVSALTWTFSIALGIVPSILAGDNFKFYDNSHVCIGLPLALTKTYSSEHTPTRVDPENSQFYILKDTFTTEFTGLVNGLYYSTALFLGLNCLCYLVILGCYVEIMRLVKKSSKQSGRTRDMKEQINLTTKVAAIVATDFLCWFPVILLGILVQTRVITLPPSVYAWSVTFVIPCNSAINPYLYTIAEIMSNYRRKQADKSETVMTEMSIQKQSDANNMDI